MVFNGNKFSKILSFIFITLSILIVGVIILISLFEPSFINLTIVKSDMGKDISELDIENIKEGTYFVNFSDLKILREFLEKSGWTFKEQKDEEFLFIKYKKNEP